MTNPFNDNESMDVESLFASSPPEGPPAPGPRWTRDEAGASRVSSDPQALLDGLNPPQREAVLHRGSPLLVVAGAGSGKTRVLTRRIAHLIAHDSVHPGAILAITFTNKAAGEMRERVGELVGNRSRFMWVATFHSACVRILRKDSGRLGISTGFSIYDATDSKRLVSLILKQMNLDAKKFPARLVRSWISDQKNALVTPAQVTQFHERFPEKVYAEVYTEYNARLAAADALDFDDLLTQVVVLLRDHGDLREKYRRRFRHVLVDEYQDTNRAQYELIHLLCAPELGVDKIDPPELMVVGDSDQSIYGFRGASIENILNFEQDFPGATTIALEQNYRSTQNILSAANSLIRHNKSRPEKNLWTDSGDGALVSGYVADTEHDEARFIATEIKTLAAGGESRYGDAAVFYRTNAQSRAVESVFIQLAVPYRVVGGVKFYERKEVRDAIAYLRAIANPADEVSIERIINVPRRGIGDTSQEILRSHARQYSITITEALEAAQRIPGLSTRAAGTVKEFAELLRTHREMMADGTPADEILRSILSASGYLDVLKSSPDPQDETRLENLAELIAVATEFVGAAHEVDLNEVETHDDDPLAGDPSQWLGDNEGAGIPGTLMGSAEVDDSLPAFLERIALVADSDEIPDSGQGMVTLMTLHTAKGLEFDTVFVTGFEEGLFPHELASESLTGLEEERRLAYVGLTRARQRLYVSRAEVRTLWGHPSYNPASRFLKEIPAQVIAWRREDRVASWNTRSRSFDAKSSRVEPVDSSLTRSTTAKKKVIPILEVGDRVLHSTFGLGTVEEVSGSLDDPRATVSFGSYGVKLLSVKHSPLEKL
ncbi:MAG: UvrD-helicase domain-containing protein [Propionibacteriaceae bacterium]|nr:UvrD-helicase domain-containing protein [Propionibacteriaceae bacterium]